LAQDAPPKAGERLQPAVQPPPVQQPLGEIPPASKIPLKISGKSLEELEQMLKASRVELGQRLADRLTNQPANQSIDRWHGNLVSVLNN
jgi:hypothetical protein